MWRPWSHLEQGICEAAVYHAGSQSRQGGKQGHSNGDQHRQHEGGGGREERKEGKRNVRVCGRAEAAEGDDVTGPEACDRWAATPAQLAQCDQCTDAALPVPLLAPPCPQCPALVPNLLCALVPIPSSSPRRRCLLPWRNNRATMPQK